MPTVTRMPRMQGLPAITSGLTVIRGKPAKECVIELSPTPRRFARRFVAEEVHQRVFFGDLHHADVTNRRPEPGKERIEVHDHPDAVFRPDVVVAETDAALLPAAAPAFEFAADVEIGVVPGRAIVEFAVLIRVEVERDGVHVRAPALAVVAETGEEDAGRGVGYFASENLAHGAPI